MFQLLVDLSGIVGAIVGLIGLFWSGKKVLQVINHHHYYVEPRTRTAPESPSRLVEPPATIRREEEWRAASPTVSHRRSLSLMGCLGVLMVPPISCCLLSYAFAVYIAATGPPKIVPIQEQSAAVGRQVTFVARLEHAGGEQAEYRWWLDGAPPGASIDPNTGTFSWTPGEAHRGRHYFFDVKVRREHWVSESLRNYETRRVHVSVGHD
jgi:hypothetical protein